MEKSIKAGFSFGVVSGIITTIGLIIGLTEGGATRAVIIGGILTIAFADAFSDAFGMHMSQESQPDHTKKAVWQSAISTFFTKLIIASTFLVPMILLPLQVGLVVSIVWAIALLSVLSYYMAVYGAQKPWKVILEHLIITTVVIIITFYIGKEIKLRFN